MKKHIPLLLILVSVFSLTACKSFPRLPLPPVYDAQGAPSDDKYVSLARETRDLAKPGEIPFDPQEALDKAIQVIESHGVKLIEKPVTGKDQFDRFTTAMPTAIYLKPGFYDQPVHVQASTLWHEIVHLRQWKRLGVKQMAVLWAVYAEGRWSLETVAYRESARNIRRFQPYYDFTVEEWAPGRAKRFWDSYALDTMSDYMRDVVTVDIWVDDEEFRENPPTTKSSASVIVPTMTAASNPPVEHEHLAMFVMNTGDTAGLTGAGAGL